MPSREYFRFRVLHEFPDSSLERAWRRFLTRADSHSHYVSPEFFLEPFWLGKRPFAVLAIEGSEIVAVLTGLHDGGSVTSGNPCRPQTCFDLATDRASAARALGRGLLAEAAAARAVTIFAWTPMETLQDMGFSLRELLGTVVLDLDQGQEALFKQLRRSRRWNIRYAAKQGVEVSEASSEDEVAAFYAVRCRWLETRPRRPHIPLPILAAACKLPDNRRLFLARHAGRIIAGQTIRFSRGGLLENEFNCSLDEERRLRPNDLLIWKTIEWGCAEGFSRYSQNGTHAFHQRSGGRIVPVYSHRLDRTCFRRYDLREVLAHKGRQALMRTIVRRTLGHRAEALSMRLYRIAKRLRRRGTLT